MNLPASACDEHTIECFLNRSLSNDEEAAFEQHLDECDQCCRQLSEMTAANAHWSDVATHLVHASEFSSRDESDEDAPSVSLEFLGPTDDPHMLGRFAGYEIAGVIGAGGMGIVLKGFDRALNRYVAIKVLQPHFASNASARQRFSREARAAAAIVHDNVIAIHGVHVDSPSSKTANSALPGSVQLPYLVMPYVRGESLQQRLDRCGSLSLVEILRISMQIALGLAAAHEQGLVHRDIKPANILLPEDVERVKITDFGLARAADDASLTRSGVIAGTPQYMSPEQAFGNAIGTKSDLFSLGSLMYTMCTGRLPFRSETPLGMLRRIVEEEPRAIRELNPEIPDWLEQIVSDLHEKDPEARPEDANVVADRLMKGLAQLQQPTPTSKPGHGPKQTPHQQRRFCGVTSRTLWKGVMATMLIVSCGLVGALVWQTVLPFGNLDNERSPSDSPSAVENAQEQGRPYTKDFELAFADPDEIGELDVDIKRGRIQVTGHDRDDILVRLVVPDYDSNSADSDEGLKSVRPRNLDFDIEGKGNYIKVDSNSDRYITNLEIQVPRHINLRLDSYTEGGIFVTHVDGNLDVRSHHGDISLVDASGSAKAWSYNGSIRASFQDVSKGSLLSFESYNGSIDIELPNDTQANTRFRTGSGTMRTDFEIVTTAETFERTNDDQGGFAIRSSDFVSGSIGDGGAVIRIETEKGDIRLRKQTPADSTGVAQVLLTDLAHVESGEESLQTQRTELAARVQTYEEIKSYVEQNLMPEYLQHAANAGVLELRREIAMAQGEFVESRKLVGQLIITYEKTIQSYEAMMDNPNWQKRFPEMDLEDTTPYRRRLEFLNSKLRDQSDAEKTFKQ